MDDDLGVFMAGMFLGIGLAAAVTFCIVDGQWSDAVVNRGLAHHKLVDPKTGETEFVWKGAKSE